MELFSWLLRRVTFQSIGPELLGKHPRGSNLFPFLFVLPYTQCCLMMYINFIDYSASSQMGRNWHNILEENMVE
jgi:hypothetical protein